MGLDFDKIRWPRIEIASHCRALGASLKKGYGEKTAVHKSKSFLTAVKRHRRGIGVAVPVTVVAMGLFAVLAFSLVGSPPGCESGLTTMSESQALAARIETFAMGFDFALFREVMKEGGEENVVLSPLSARMALAMAYNGASDKVAEEMAYVLDFEGMSLEEVNAMMRDLITSLLGADENVQLEIANSIWSDDEMVFDPGFRQRCVESYDAEVASVNFQGGEDAEIINRWVDEKTQGKIKDIADNLDFEDIEAMLINTIYFKGTWTWGFDSAMNTESPFHLAGGGTKEVTMMHRSGKLDYLENEDFQAVSLPYGSERLSMYVFLPREERSLEDFMGNLNRENWERWMAAFESLEGQIGLPRFGNGYEKNLNSALSSLGMGSAFTGFAFPHMFLGRIAGEGPFIGDVIQKTSVGVNELGTEAASATIVDVCWAGISYGIHGFIMEIDRPFFFAICDNQTGTILFMGSIYEP